ncbi:MAG TPA: ABC transporter substrate-binding protein [Euzebyales bacterium]|nr:ABC transporter substrate-binding protein [Euzebyales bacterium]
MRIRGRSQRWVLLLAVLALIAAACSGGGGEAAEGEGGEGGDTSEAAEGGDEEGASGNEISFYVSEPQFIAPPSNVTESEGHAVITALFRPLIDVDLDTSEPQWGDDAPDAHAANLESDDQQTWTVTLKDGWTFHDGTPVTAQSYVDTWNEGAANAEYTGNYFFSFIEGYDALQGTESEPAEATEMSGLEVIDDLTFEVTLTEPFSQFPLVLYYSAFYPLADACLEDMAACQEAPIGNGPFQMDGQWEHNQRIRVTKFADYGGETEPSIDAIEFRVYSDVNTGYNDLLAGNLDVLDTVPPEQIETAQTDLGERFIEGESSVYTYLGFPTFDERFDDVNVRRAFSMAIDRQAIVDNIRVGDAPADAFVSPVVAGYREGACGDACTYDPEEAARLLEEAGGWEGPLTLWFNSGAGHEEWMEAVSNQLRENLGIEDISFESLDFAEYLPILEALEHDGPFRLGWVMDYPSPQNYLENLLYTESSSNYTGWSNEEFDSLIDQGNAAGTVEEGLEFYAQAEDIAAEEVPQAPLFFDRLSAAHSERVTNVEFNIQEDLDYLTVEVVE